MVASHTSSDSSRKDTPSDRTQQEANAAGVQQWFDAWMNAWRSLGAPAAASGNPFTVPSMPDFAKAATAQAGSLPFSNPLFEQMAKQFAQAAEAQGQPNGASAGAPFSAFFGQAFNPQQFTQQFTQQLAGLKVPSASIPPSRLQQLQSDYSRDAMQLLQQASQTSSAGSGIELKDRRFSAEAWKTTPMYAYTAAWYLLNARYLQELADSIEADLKTRERIRFAVQQWTAAASPSNFFALNPEAQKTLLESNGESLRQGVMNLLGDMQRGKISQTDESRFGVGKNLAMTEGAVVFENDLMQLLQYKPRTATVHERPLLIVPPCINKYYILDLQPENSLVAHALESGHQVYLISWRSADQSIAHKTWDDYIADGVLAAIDTMRQISGREQINTLGFCIGGTLLASALAVASARGEHPAASMTLLTAMLDFGDTGVLDIFVDEAHVQMREQTIGGKNGTPPGLMRGVEFANAFSFLRPNDLVWNYVVDNYLKGRTPMPFDLLYWNSDSTSLPGPMYCWYLRNTYLENKLREPGALTTCGEKVDLSRIDVPTFIYGSREDHIVPWQTAYASVPLLTGPRTFVLGASGHIAGVINPPAKKKRSYWSVAGDDKALPENPDDWFANATETAGSWWPEWTNWLAQYGGKKVKPAAKLGSDEFPVIEAAPGRYVQARE